MNTTLTIRADEKLRLALKARAAMQHKTVSEIVREILEDALAERPLADSVGHLKGRLEERTSDSDRWADAIGKRNWRE